MMDSILNVGLNDESVAGLARSTGNEEFARDCYRRLIQMFGETVDGIPHESFSVDDTVEQAREIYERETGHGFPQDARDQLQRAVTAVFDSWNSSRAQVYRRTYGIADDLGTAVNIVQMVFGNKGEGSATGVAFTRDPSTGEQGVYGEYLVNAQGEDVVAGTRTPQPLAELRGRLPEAYDQLLETMAALERHYRDMQDIEFTVEEGHLYLLQTRTAKRTAAAAIKCAVDMTAEGLIERDEAVAREAVILVRWETTPDDIHGLIQAQGVLTAHGGMTSHAAVVARGMGKPCVAGCEDLDIDSRTKTVRIGRQQLREGDVITIDGGTGRVIVGEVPLVPPAINEDFETILEWADDLRRLKVRANADNAEDAAKAREFGAQGIGLCRTEHMFFGEERLPVMQEMILADDEAGRRDALGRLLPFQQSDFEGIFEAMAGLPVTIRVLDPPLHEFLPDETDATDERMRRRIRQLHEDNPMLGTRGCRLGLQWPEIYEMQVRAIARAATAVLERGGETPLVEMERGGETPLVEIMHPLVGFREELRRLRELTERVMEEEAPELEYLCGTMIELPRAALRADEIAEVADFFSFGTNDLTQTALGMSRDDAEGKFLTFYLEDGVLERNPFEVLDQDGVGELMRIAVGRGRETKPEIKLGICGEHGGEPSSVEFCHRIGLDYVSCSPYRVPLARLAAAQAVLHEAKRAEYVQAGG